MGELTACRLGPSASPHMKSFFAPIGNCCATLSEPPVPGSQSPGRKRRISRATPSPSPCSPVTSGEVFRRSNPIFTPSTSWNIRRRAVRTVQLSLRFAGPSQHHGAPRGRHLSKNNTQCMTISAQTAARVPVRDLAATAAAAAAAAIPRAQTARLPARSLP